MFCAHTPYMNYATTRFYWLVPQNGLKKYCVLCTVKAKKANKNIQQNTLSCFITSPFCYDHFNFSTTQNGKLSKDKTALSRLAEFAFNENKINLPKVLSLDKTSFPALSFSPSDLFPAVSFLSSHQAQFPALSDPRSK